MSVAVPRVDEGSAAQNDAVTWPVFDAPLIGRELVAEGTMSFSFAKPPGWDFRAGQFIDITLTDPPMTDAEGDTRGFSISSAPSEGVITITTRLRDTAFKRSLQAVPLDTIVTVEGPFGELQLDESSPAVVLTGGIGITPFRSIAVETSRHGGFPQRVVLIHSNRGPGGAPFLAELQHLADRDQNLDFVPTMTALEPEDEWTGERSMIDVALLRRHLDGVSEAPFYLLDGPPFPIYYLTGPAAFVRAMRAMLDELGISAADIRTEEFTGY